MDPWLPADVVLHVVLFVVALVALTETGDTPEAVRDLCADDGSRVFAAFLLVGAAGACIEQTAE